MNCAKCPHDKTIFDALLPCQTCEHWHLFHASTAGNHCATCAHYKPIAAAFRFCQNCDAGRLHGTCHIGEEKLDYALSRMAVERRDGGSGCTALAADVEDDLRKALSHVFQLTDYKTAPVMLAMLKGGRFFKFIRLMRMTKREFVEAAHRAQSILSIAKRHLETDASKAAAKKIVSEMCKLNALKDAATVLAIFKGDSSPDFAHKAGLKSRQAAHARIVSLFERFPYFLPMYNRNVDLGKHLPLADGWRSADAVKPRTMDKRMPSGWF